MGQAEIQTAHLAPVHLAGMKIQEVEAPSQLPQALIHSPMPEILSGFRKGFENAFSSE